MVKKICLLFLALAFWATGCTVLTQEQFAKVHEGMSQREVMEAVGPPLAARQVRFKGHESDYLVWEYMVPSNKPI